MNILDRHTVGIKDLLTRDSMRRLNFEAACVHSLYDCTTLFHLCLVEPYYKEVAAHIVVFTSGRH